VTRTVPAAIAAKLANKHPTLSRCLRLDLRDGTSIGITDHDRSLLVNLGDGDVTYSASTGALPSDVSLTMGFEVDNFEVTGPVGETFSLAAILGGRFDRARARLFDADWQAPGNYVPLLKGRVAEARVEGGGFIMAVRSDVEAYNQVIGRVLSPFCTHDYGDARCQAVVPTFPATVATVTDELAFTVTFTGSTPSAGQLVMGTCEFLTGDLAGTLPIEVFAHSGASITLFAPAAAVPEVGDTLMLSGGCSKLRRSEDVTVVTCLSNSNVENFGGFPDAPGSSQYLKYAVPGSSA
jgi:uncharacterized phage protein (TIGR02218 family)